MPAEPAPPAKRLNVGCGRNALPGWVNLDIAALPGVDVVADLAACRTAPLPFAAHEFDEFLLSHVLEHVGDTLALMQELHRIAKPDAKAVIRLPHGASDDAWEDPTHVRPYFPGSFVYFAQPAYWRADYGYRGDWQVERIVLLVDKRFQPMPPAQVAELARKERNVVKEMVAEMRAVHPIREPKRELMTKLRLELALV